VISVTKIVFSFKLSREKILSIQEAVTLVTRVGMDIVGRAAAASIVERKSTEAKEFESIKFILKSPITIN